MNAPVQNAVTKMPDVLEKQCCTSKAYNKPNKTEVCIWNSTWPILQELREDNSILLETKNMLEDQLEQSHKRIETVVDLETELVKYRQQAEQMAMVCRLITDAAIM